MVVKLVLLLLDQISRLRVVNKDVSDHVTVAGVPAKVINTKGSDVIHGDSRF